MAKAPQKKLVEKQRKTGQRQGGQPTAPASGFAAKKPAQSPPPAKPKK